MQPLPLTLLCVHAHPDDECLGTGGVLARYAAEGITTVLVTATGGEEGEIVVPDLNTPEHLARLSDIRAAELAAAVEVLGITHFERLGYRDSGMVGSPANANPACFHMADKFEATGRLVRLIRHYRPQVLVSYDERGGYWHPDHLACYLTTMAAYYAAGDGERYPEAGPAWQPLKLYLIGRPRELTRRTWEQMAARGLPNPLNNPQFEITRFTVEDQRVTTVVPIHAYLGQKRRAIACHVTQIAADGPWLTMPDDLAHEFFGTEYFIRADTRVALPAGPEDDLFAGLR